MYSRKEGENNMSIRTVNKALNAMGIDAEIVKGKEYFYLVGEGVSSISTTMICVSKFSDMTDSQWIEEVKKILAGNKHNFY